MYQADALPSQEFTLFVFRVWGINGAEGMKPFGLFKGFDRVSIDAIPMDKPSKAHDFSL